MNKQTLAKILGTVALCAGVLVAYRVFGWDRMGPINSLKVNLATPDALIVTHSLASLPRDLLTIPLARDVLKEDFLFYYEQGEDRLGLQGSLRRIAYEHELNWGDQLIRSVLDEPAEVALWRDSDGALKHFAISVTRASFTRLLEEAGKVALKDTQMKLAGEVSVDGDKVKVFALDYARGRTMLFAARGNRMVILSHAGMLYGDDKKKTDDEGEKVVAGMLSADRARQQAFRSQFGLGEPVAGSHSVAVKTDFLSFRYQAFFKSLVALRFDFGKGGWSTRALVDASKMAPGAYDNSALWPALPHNPAACVAVPADWTALQPVLAKLDGAAAVPVAPLSTMLSGPAAVCWYAKSKLHTPLFVATSAPNANPQALFEALFALSIGDGGTQFKASEEKGARLWQRSVEGRNGGGLTPTLATKGRVVVFSPDQALARQAMAVLGKTAPAAGDSVPDARRTVALLTPAALAGLIESESMAALPESKEEVLRGAAKEHLLPRLAALKKYPAYRLVLKDKLPSSGAAWVQVEWQAAGK